MISSIYETQLTLITIFTLCIQLYVFYLVQTKSPRNMKGYSFFLNMFTLWDLIFCIFLGVLLQPSSLSPWAAVTVQGLSKYLGKEAGMITSSLVFYAGSNVIMYQTYCLIYRYTILHNNKLVHTIFMSSYSKFVYTVFVQFMSGCLGYFMYLVLMPQSEVQYHMFWLTHSFKGNQIKSDDIVIVLNLMKPMGPCFMGTIVALFVLDEIISIVLIFMILSILRKNAGSFSHSAYKVHKQFTLVLAVQLMIPIIFVFLPVVGAILAIFVHHPVSEWTMNAGFLLMTSYGAFNGMFTIFFVSTYRWHAYNQLIRPWLEPIFSLLGVDAKLPKQPIRPEAPPTTSDQHVKRNKIDVYAAGLQLVEMK